MKRILFALISVVASLTSCEQIILDGDWDPIELDKKHVNFPSEGGQNTVSALNYSRWWICGGYGSKRQVNGRWENDDYVYPTSSVEEYVTYDTLDGDWFHVLVPDQGKSNTVIITVEPNEGSEPRTAIIDMTVGDSFTSISISQK
jgi:hypothetical protein